MKRTIITLSLLLSFLLCGCSKEDAPSGTVEVEIADEAAQTTQTVVAKNVEEYVEKPFAEEMGLNFVSPGEYTVPLILSGSRPELDIIFSSSGMHWSAPEIRCEADGEDYLIYAVTFIGSSDLMLRFERPQNVNSLNYRWKSSVYGIYDYYTGMEIKPDVRPPHNDESVDNLRIYTVEYNNKAAEITCARIDNQQMEGNTSVNDGYITIDDSLLYSVNYTIRVPRDYDGLMLGISPNHTPPIPDDPFAEEVIDEQIHYFGEKEEETAENYEFIRIADYVDIPAVSTTANNEDA